MTICKIFKKKCRDGSINYWVHTYENGKRTGSICVYSLEEAEILAKP
jgi:hypothetical protein